MSVAFHGFQENAVTFKVSGEVTAGKPVKLASAATVTPCSAGDVFIGFALESDSAYAAVRLRGAVTANYTGTAPTVGFTKLVADTNGVKTGSAGREYLVLDVNTTAATVTFLM